MPNSTRPSPAPSNCRCKPPTRSPSTRWPRTSIRWSVSSSRCAKPWEMFPATRRSLVPPSDVRGVMPSPAAGRGKQVLALYDRALPEVYGYLLHRCGDTTVAEDLTSETFLAAVRADDAAPVSVPWLI